jgi:hypothetical protein
VLRKDGYRFFFFSREEPRMHVHVSSSDGEAKWWLEPQVELAYNHQMNAKQLREMEVIVREHFGDFVDAWQRHFGN